MFDKIKEILKQGMLSQISEVQFYEEEIKRWKHSRKRLDAITGEKYLFGEHDILRKKRMAIGDAGRLIEVDNLPNNHIVDNQYRKMVLQKQNYLFGKTFTLNTDNEAYRSELKKIFNKRFYRKLKTLGSKSLTGALSWLCLFYNELGELDFKVFPSYEILPFWQDSEHTRLDAAIRLYEQEVYEGRELKLVEKIEIYSQEGIRYYTLINDMLVPDIEKKDQAYLTISDGNKTKPYNWGRIPLIAFKYNESEIPLLNKIKSLQDGINDMLSSFKNNMEEDNRNTILVLVNYDGQNLGEFRRNLAQYGAVKVVSEGDGIKGDVKTLTVEVNASNYKEILELFKKALIENAMGYDAKDDRLAGNPNQMNIESMYNDIDMDANNMETEFQAALEELMWFINAHLYNTGKGDFSGDVVEFEFNRDTLTNQSEIINDCRNSVGVISDETIISRHPWVKDVKKEQERLEKQKEADNDYLSAFEGTANEE